MKKTNPQVDGYLRKNKKWDDVLKELRRILLECPLTEEVKWRHPCYTADGRNIVILGAFKEYCVLNFVKGALLNDTKHILVKPGEDTQVSRVIRFTHVDEIAKLESALKGYVGQAIKVEKSGLKVELKKITERKIPEELQTKFDESPALKTAFGALTPGRQRAYLIHFSGAKQSKTREARVEKYMPLILDGKGMDD